MRTILGAPLMTLTLLSAAAMAQDAAPPAAASPGETIEQGMTLMQLIEAGGTVMLVIGGLAVLATALTLFYAITLRVGRFVDPDFSSKLYTCLFQRDLEGALGLCTRKRGFVAEVLLAGLTLDSHDRAAVQEAMQAEGARRAAVLWQRVTYLQDIAVLTPMLGILGTVLGMIRSFNVIAFSASGVKPVALAAGVSQALVTTAAGLAVAIPTMFVFFIFRGRVQRIIASAEAVSAQFLEKVVQAKVGR